MSVPRSNSEIAAYARDFVAKTIEVGNNRISGDELSPLATRQDDTDLSAMRETLSRIAEQQGGEVGEAVNQLILASGVLDEAKTSRADADDRARALRGAVEALESLLH